MPEDNAVICVGEALVDFVSEPPGTELTQARSFAARFGGSQANVAVGATRFGARSALLGGVGDDAWGRWLRDRLVAEGVDVSGFALLEGVDTPHAFVAVGPDGEPEFTFFGDGEACVASAAGLVQGAFESTRGVFVFGSDSLIGPVGRQATGQARRLALERGWSVLYDPNLRPRRWPDDATMRAEALEQLAGCTVVKTNLDEARALTGEADLEAAALGLCSLGARSAVVTAGAEGAVVVAEGAQARAHSCPPGSGARRHRRRRRRHRRAGRCARGRCGRRAAAGGDRPCDGGRGARDRSHRCPAGSPPFGGRPRGACVGARRLSSGKRSTRRPGGR